MPQTDSDRKSNPWTSVLTLNSDRTLRSGSSELLSAAVRRGADLRILTEFRHNEHIDTQSASRELIREVCDFQIAYLIDDRWVAGIMQMRQPVQLPDSFGPRPSLSFFLYNQDGEQGIARPFLDGAEFRGELGAAPFDVNPRMPRYHQRDNWDAGTNAPSHNFVYDFDVFEYFVRDEWREVCSHDALGNVEFGTVAELGEAFRCGSQIKVALRGFCGDLVQRGDLAQNGNAPLEHEVFIQAGSCYFYTGQKLFIAGTNPLVRVRPSIPLQYASQSWDCGWCVARTDGRIKYRALDPYTLKFREMEQNCALRWFVR